MTRCATRKDESPERLRATVAAKTPRQHKAALGQFMTPEPVARFMASMFRPGARVVSLLEPGAGLGALACAVVDRWMQGDLDAASIDITAYELDERIRRHLERTLSARTEDGATFRCIGGDYLAEASRAIGRGERQYTHAILNPPYKKIATSSDARVHCRRVGLETVNLYSAFVGLALAQLRPQGQLVAIIPRSFCNGPYYRPFREFLLERAALRHIHLFESRDHAFRDDDVLQENVIILLERDAPQGTVQITTSRDASFSDLATRIVPFSDVVKPHDSDVFIHIPSKPDVDSVAVSTAVRNTLADLGIAVSTGPVVDFRLREHLVDAPSSGTVPLLYPTHFSGRVVSWPQQSKKPNAISRNKETERWLFPLGTYTVVRRFSSKEERRRVVATVLSPDDVDGADAIGFENHLNVFHQDKKGLPSEVAWGLFVYLNSTAIDDHLRRFSGHTQVNATDLRAIRYPDLQTLATLGRWAIGKRTQSPNQRAIDERIGELLR